ncbi:MAG: GNAT family N-acetyltransferase [Planctomycetota bacterium]
MGPYVWRDDGKICGLVGLHRYIWGSEENVWLSWFAVHPKHQDRGIGSTLMDAVKEHAARAGYKKLLIETYDSPTFKKARSFYRARGFRQVGRALENEPRRAMRTKSLTHELRCRYQNAR